MSRTLEHRIEQLEKPGVHEAEQSVWVMVRGWDAWYQWPTRSDCILKWPELASKESWFFFPAKDGLDAEGWEGWFTWDCETDDAEYRPGLKFMAPEQFIELFLDDDDMPEVTAENVRYLVRLKREEFREFGAHVSEYTTVLAARVLKK